MPAVFQAEAHTIARGESAMRHATRNIPDHGEDTHGARDVFAIGAVVCAAFVVAMFALHGGPNLLGDRFDTGVITAQPR
jgi:hypothetical protein